MCGIAAIARLGLSVSDYMDKDAEAQDIQQLKTMVSLIGHRGPDDAGYTIARPCHSKANRVSLGHVRLTIRDLEAGPQPMMYEVKGETSGTVMISYNGEIYDIEEQRQELEEQGYSFRTTTDTEVVLVSFVHHGIECFGRLNGEFAFVIYDSRTDDVYAVRDRYGIKPLFTAFWHEATYFASEAKAILGILGFPRQFSRRFLNQTVWGCYDEGQSAFEGIRSVAPGTYLHVDRDGLHKYHQYSSPAWTPDSRMTPTLAAEGIKAGLVKAISRRLASDVPVCAYLSGGIDSAVVAGLAREIRGSLKAFNLSFGGGTDYDERSGATAIARHFDIDLEVVECGAEEMANNLEQALYHTETSTPNPSVVGKYLLSKAAYESGYKVTLTGEGSDEILAGYPFFKLEHIWRMMEAESVADRQYAERLFQKFKRLEKRSEGLLWNDNHSWRTLPRAVGFASANLLRASTFDVYRRLALRAHIVGNGNVSAASAFEDYDASALAKLHPLHASLHINLHHLSNWIFPSLGDRPEMGNHMEGRTPFLDNDLTSFISTIPPDYLINIHELREKAPLYAAFHGWLPKTVTDDHKHPFLAPGWRDVLSTTGGKALVGRHLNFFVLWRAGIFQPIVVWLALILWWVLPKDRCLFRKLDAFVGVVLSVQILHHSFIVNRPEAHPRAIKLVSGSTDAAKLGTAQSL